MKTTKSKKQMWLTIGILAILVFALCVTGIVLGVKGCKSDQDPSPSGTAGNGNSYETPIDSFR